jgi:multiple sugar transport system permease protein
VSRFIEGFMRRHHLVSVASHAFLIGACVIAVVPIFWGVVTSLKENEEIFSFPTQWLPDPVTIEHYKLVLFGSNFPRFFTNSAVVSILTILVTLAIAAHAAYAAARLKYRGKNVLLFLILATSMIPGISVLAPLYQMTVAVGLHDTYFALVLVYSAWQVPTVIWLLRGFIETVPAELDEAAMIDGCSRLQAFYRVVLPTLQPGLAAGAIMTFVFVWNDFLIGSVLTIGENMRPIQVGLYRYMGDVGVEWGRFLAYGVLALLPIMVVFLILQRRFISGLTSGAVKG